MKIKKLLVLVLCVVMVSALVLPSRTMAIFDPTYRYGDMDGDGEFSNVDLVKIARFIVNIDSFNIKQFLLADADGNKDVDNSDLVTFARMAVGLPTNIKELYMTGLGQVSGQVVRASDIGVAVPDASVIIWQDGYVFTEGKTDAEGNYSVGLPEGEYLIVISKQDYINFGCYARVEQDTVSYTGTFPIVTITEDVKGTAQGRVVNSLTGSGEPNVTLKVRDHWNNQGDGDVMAETITDEYGNYTVELPLGNYTVEASKDDFVTSYFNIFVKGGTTANQEGTITPIVGGETGSYLITLTWGENPVDMDSHVVGRYKNGDSFHVYYYDVSAWEDGEKICDLDYDDTTSYGPEHITLTPNASTPYYYYVYKYDGSGTTASSQSHVTIHKDNVLIAEFNVPTNQGDGDYWNVFAIKDGQIIVKNTVTAWADITYAD